MWRFRLQKIIWCLQKLSGDGRTPLSITTSGWSHITKSIQEGDLFSSKLVGSLISWLKSSMFKRLSSAKPSALVSPLGHQLRECALKSPTKKLA